MKPYLGWLVAGLAIGLLFYQWQCRGKIINTKPEKDLVVVKYDSLVAKNKIDSLAASDTIHMLLNMINDAQYRADDREKKLIDKIAQSDFTIIRMRAAKQGKDTVRYVQLCDSLREQYEVDKQAGLAFKFERDSLLQLWPKVHQVDSMEIVRLEYENKLKDGMFGNLSKIYDTTDQQLNTFRRMANKHWGIGPQIGYGIVGGKPLIAGWFIGVGVHYTLIKF